MSEFFHSWSKALYELELKSEYHETLYINDAQMFMLESYHTDGIDDLNDKSKFDRFVPERLSIPIVGTIKDDEVWVKDPRALEHGVLAKPTHSSSAEGICRCYSMEHLTMLAGEGSSYIITPVVRTHHYASDVWSWSCNTMRVLTYIDPEGHAQIAGAVHKWGTTGSGVADNWNKGGLSTYIDHDGVLGLTFEDFTTPEQRDGHGSGRVPFFERKKGLTVHPESGRKISGTRVPNYERVADACLEVAEANSDKIQYVGWDVYVNQEGEPRFIEGNPWPGVQLMQVHGPLLVEEGLAIFFEEYLKTVNLAQAQTASL